MVELAFASAIEDGPSVCPIRKVAMDGKRNSDGALLHRLQRRGKQC